jgi:hypothetical protein
MNQDILLPVDLPAEALKLAWWQVSCLQAVNGRFRRSAHPSRRFESSLGTSPAEAATADGCGPSVPAASLIGFRPGLLLFLAA